MFDYMGSLVVRFFRIVFIQVKFKISLSLSNIRITTRTFKFIHRIASFQMCLLVLVLKMISNRMCFLNERQMSKFFQIFSKKSSAILFLVVEMFRQGRAGKDEFFECHSSFSCSHISSLSLVLTYLRKLRSYVGFVLALSAYLFVLLSLLANLTGLAVLLLLLTSFASHCYFLRHRVFGFELLALPSVALYFD